MVVDMALTGVDGRQSGLVVQQQLRVPLQELSVAEVACVALSAGVRIERRVEDFRVAVQTPSCIYQRRIEPADDHRRRVHRLDRLGCSDPRVFLPQEYPLPVGVDSVHALPLFDNDKRHLLQHFEFRCPERPGGPSGHR